MFRGEGAWLGAGVHGVRGCSGSAGAGPHNLLVWECVYSL